MDGVAELVVQGVDARVDVVLKQPTESCPQGSSGGGVAEDKVENLGGHPLVDPLYSGEVVLHPARIRGLGNGVVVDVAEEIAAA